MFNYKRITDILKHLSIEEAYHYLSENIGCFHNPFIDVSSMSIIVDNETNQFKKYKEFDLSFNKNNPRLVGPHTGKEYCLMCLGAKPLIYDAFGLKELSVSDNYYSEENLIAIDKIYVDLFKFSRKYAKNKVSDKVIGTILGYSKKSIELFLTMQDVNSYYGFGEKIYFNELDGLFDTVLGIYDKSTAPNKDIVLNSLGLYSRILYSGEIKTKELDTLLFKMRSIKILNENFKLIRDDDLFFGEIDFILIK